MEHMEQQRESGPAMSKMTRVQEWNDSKIIRGNLIAIAILNFVQFILTIYGNHKLATDTNHADFDFDHWYALRVDLVVAVLTWFFLAYGWCQLKRHRTKHLPSFIISEKGGAQLIADAIICLLQLIAASLQTAFILNYKHCNENCDALNKGSYGRNTAYTIFAWFLTVVWLLQLGYSAHSWVGDRRDLRKQHARHFAGMTE